MAHIRFEWDEAKNISNQSKHGLSFTQAAQVFHDPFAITRKDVLENGELRWQTFGIVDGQLLLMVAHTLREQHSEIEIIRIISARRATRKERRFYEDENG